VALIELGSNPTDHPILKKGEHMREIYGAVIVNTSDVPTQIDTLQTDPTTQIVALFKVDDFKILIVIKKVP
jgi:hypothetical protein